MSGVLSSETYKGLTKHSQTQSENILSESNSSVASSVAEYAMNSNVNLIFSGVRGLPSAWCCCSSG